MNTPQPKNYLNFLNFLASFKIVSVLDLHLGVAKRRVKVRVGDGKKGKKNKVLQHARK